MEPGDIGSIAAVVIAAIALIVSLFTRRADIARDKHRRKQDHVRDALYDPARPTTRTINRLHELADQVVEERITLLRATVVDLETAGADTLADQLSALLEQPWGTQTSEQSKECRKAFNASLKSFLNS